MDKITQILENVVWCKYFEAGVHIKNPIKNSYQDGLGKMTQTLDHVVVVHILIWDNIKSQINEYSDLVCCYLIWKIIISYKCAQNTLIKLILAGSILSFKWSYNYRDAIQFFSKKSIYV